MYQKYFVYIDDGRTVFKIAVAAARAEAAAAYCAGNGEIVAVKDVSADYPIDVEKVCDALRAGGFGTHEIHFISRTLTELGIAE